MLFVWRGSVLPRIMPQLLWTTALAVLVTWTHGQLIGYKFNLTAIPFTLLGVALAVFLGFRNNASYDRYWEARKLWGALLNDSRSLARQVVCLTECPPDERRRLVYALGAFAHALRHQLRGSDGRADMARLLAPEAANRVCAARHPAAVALALLGEQLAEARRGGRVEPILAAAMEPNLSGLSHVLGGCERIANTPLPFTYAVIIHRIVYLYCFLLPFGLVDSVGTLTPVIVAFVAYCFFALEALSDEIEEPFGTMPNDLALAAMATHIESTLRETLGEVQLPEPPAPVDYLLF